MKRSVDLNKPAAPDATLFVGAGVTLYAGTLDDLDWHLHGAPVFVAGMTGNFRLRLPDGEWAACRAAIVPAGVRHALELGGDPVAVFYPEPTIADVSHLTRLGGGWDDRHSILFTSGAELGIFRDIYEDRGSPGYVDEAIKDLVRFLRKRQSEPSLDPRIARVIERLRRQPEDLTAVASLSADSGLSVSRFLHLFSSEIGIPFRRYRIWNRVRAALAMMLAGQNLTAAALNAGFSDSSHFARLHRQTFGVAASCTFRRIARKVTARPQRQGPI